MVTASHLLQARGAAEGLCVVGASAGSGKTYHLTRVVLDALGGAGAALDVESLVAVTYTTRAATELRSRIRQELVRRGETENALRLPLARLGTVHAVCLSWVEDYAIDAGLPPGVRVLPDDGGLQFRLLLEGCACVEGEPLQCGSSTDVGVCAFGTATCVNGAFGPCTGAVPPAPRDSCVRGDDSNCNGIANEGCACINGETRPCGPPSVGVCRGGVQTCVNGVFNGECVGAVTAGTRNCNSPADNDCDGRPDNTIDNVCRCAIGTSQACGTHPQDGIGPCRAGSQQCVAGPGNSSSAFGSCTGSVGPAPADLCDGSDTNCNGQSDDDCGSPEGSDCTNDSDCNDNTDCVTFYGDGDEDGFAAVDAIQTAVRLCASVTFRLPQFTRVRPASRATTDCLDTNDVVKPGQTAFFTAPVVGLTPAFDYDCDGIEADPTNNKVSDCDDQTIVNCVDRGGWSGAPPACGQTGGIQPCGEPEDTVGLCALFPGGPSSPRQCH